MSTFTFKGFTTGSVVALAAAQGAVSDSASVSNWGQGASGSVDILTVASSSQTAPAGVWFEAINVADFTFERDSGTGNAYDPSFHEITYIWTVRGNPLAAFTAPENMVTGWNDPNTAYGKKVAFLFNDPGTYTVDLWAVSPTGTTAIAEASVNVADPDTVYPGTNTICYSTGGSWSGEKPGCQRITSVAALQSALQAAATPPRVLFKRGQTITDMELFVNGGLLGYVGAWGTGDKPIVRSAHTKNAIQFWNQTSITDFTITDIDFRGGWDAASETGVRDLSPLDFKASPTACHYTIAHCSFSGFMGLFLGTGQDHPAQMIFANNVITNWRDYGMFVHNTFDDDVRFAVIGCRITQNINALNGGTKNGLYNNHGPIRCTDAANFYISVTDLFSRNGWSGLSPDNADQPCLRYNHLGSQNRFFNMDRCVCEGGFHPLAFAGQNGGTIENPGNFVIDKALLIGTAKTSKAFIVAEFGGLTVRNTIGIMPNSPFYHGIAWAGAVRYEIDNPIANNITTPMALYGSSFVNLRSAANDNNHDWLLEQGGGVFDIVTVENNVLHGPGLDTPVTGDAPVNTSGTIPGVIPRYRGVLYNFEHESGVLSGSVPSGGSFTLPYPQGTDQAYWQAIEATDTDHLIGIGSFFYVERGEFSVTFQSSNVRITNTTGSTWASGENWNLRLDRKSQLPGLDATYASPATLLPMPVVQSGSPGFETADLGYQAYDDFFCDVRTSPKSAGAIEP